MGGDIGKGMAQACPTVPMSSARLTAVTDTALSRYPGSGCLLNLCANTMQVCGPCLSWILLGNTEDRRLGLRPP